MEQLQQPTPLEILTAALDDGETRKRLAKKLGYFCLIYLPHYFALPPAEFFPDLIAALEDDNIDRLMEIGFRGSAKSTFTSMAYVIYAALVKPELYPLNQFGAGSNMTISTSTASTGGGAADLYAGVMAIKPFNTPVAGVQNASSASVAAGNTRCTGFIGFANSSVTVGQTLTVFTQGVVSGLSLIQSGIEYFLNDTNGTIGTSAGTNSRKVGVGIDNSHLLITNVW